MSKASRNRQQAARERIAAQRAAARKAEIRKRTLIVAGSVIAVIAVVVVFIVIKVGSNSNATHPTGSVAGTPLPASVNRQITGVPVSTLAKVGAGTWFTGSIEPITGKPLTSGGKPEVLYIGAEYCPYCATERWAMAAALGRFGTFSPLHGIHSSPTDSPPSIPSVTFYKSTYSSKYVTFTPVEVQKVDRSPLQTLTPQQQALQSTYDIPPRTTTAGSIPFMDISNKYMISGATYSYAVLQGKTWAQVAAAMQDPSTPIAQGAVGSANMLTAAICKITGNQPASVCAAAPIPALQSKL
jgi:thiol-disulfide isomerase/thioredoxin